MVWLAWRQFRAQAALAGVAVAITVIALAVTRGHVVDTYRPSGTGELTGIYVSLRLLGTVVIGVPAVIGAFWGAPLLAREFEASTHRLVWTQSVTRRRWLTVKLAVTALVAAAAVAMVALAFTWWAAPIDATGNRIGTANFAQRGIVPIGYAMFGLALGTLAGTVLRKTLPAMATSLAGFFVVRLVVQQLVRAHLVPVRSVDIAPFGPNELKGWVLATRTVDAAGHTLSRTALESQLTTACNITRETTDVDAALAQCAHQLGFHDVARMHTADQFWALQAAELGIFIVLSGLLTATTFWWVSRRTA